jgi:hypothetical protein
VDPVDHVDKAEIYRCGVDEAGGLAVKKIRRFGNVGSKP